MVKTCLKVIFLIAFVFVFSPFAFAGSGVLSSIGAMDASAGYSEWWYTSENPTLSGIAQADAEVSISINDSTSTVNANSSGNWSYTPTALTTGDHNVVVSSGGDSYSFILHAGQDFPGSSTTTESTESSGVPATGFSQVLWITAGLALVSLGYSMNVRKAALAGFEKDIREGAE